MRLPFQVAAAPAMRSWRAGRCVCTDRYAITTGVIVAPEQRLLSPLAGSSNGTGQQPEAA